MSAYPLKYSNIFRVSARFSITLVFVIGKHVQMTKHEQNSNLRSVKNALYTCSSRLYN